MFSLRNDCFHCAINIFTAFAQWKHLLRSEDIYYAVNVFSNYIIKSCSKRMMRAFQKQVKIFIGVIT